MLNRHWSPVTFLPVSTAIVMCMRGQASVLDHVNYLLFPFDEWVLHSPEDHDWIKTSTGQIAAPQIVVLKKYGERPPRRVNFNKFNLARRDNYSCQYCGESIGVQKMTIDHVLPRSRGGKSTWENCVAACARCNGLKADRTPKEARMQLRKEPTRPAWSPVLQIPSGKMRPSWQLFLSKEAVA